MTDSGAQVDERYWERGWEGHSTAQRLRLSRLSLIEKLDWLEQAHQLVLHLASQRQGGGGVKPSPPDPED